VKLNKKTAITAARVILGLIFTLNGLNGLMMVFTGKGFLPMPAGMPEAAMSFMGALGATGYMFPVIKVVELVCGLALLAGMFAPLALVLLAPIIVNIFLFHLFLAPSGLIIAVLVTGLALFLGHSWRDTYKPMFKKK
jgi:putative oxidoreductase